MQKQWRMRTKSDYLTRTQSTENVCGKVDGFGVPPPLPPIAALMMRYMGTSGTLPAPVTVRRVLYPAPSSPSTDQINELSDHSNRYTM